MFVEMRLIQTVRRVVAESWPAVGIANLALTAARVESKAILNHVRLLIIKFDFI